MATHSSVLAWRIPGTGEPGGRLSMGLHRVGHDWSDLAAAANCSTPGFPVLHYIPEFAQTHVHWVSDAVQPSLSLSPPSPPALSLSQNQSLFQWVGSLHQVTTVLELQLQYQSFQMNIQGWFPLTGLISLQFKGLSRVFSSTTVWKHQFNSITNITALLPASIPSISFPLSNNENALSSQRRGMEASLSKSTSEISPSLPWCLA